MPVRTGPFIAATPSSSRRFFSASGISSFSTLPRKSASSAESLPLSSNGAPDRIARPSASTGSNAKDVGTMPRSAAMFIVSMPCLTAGSSSFRRET